MIEAQSERELTVMSKIRLCAVKKLSIVQLLLDQKPVGVPSDEVSMLELALVTAEGMSAR